MFHPQGPTFLELARQGLSSTQRGYDLLAPKFDFTPFRTPDSVLGAVGEQLAPVGPFARGLDLCCGTGAAMRMLRPLCRELLVGLDFSTGMLAQARHRLGLDAPHPPAGPRMALVRADTLALPFEDAFDIVTCFGAFGHILRRDEPRFVRGIHRALRPGGRFVFVTLPTPRVLSPTWVLGHGYNALAHLRNLLVRPPFVMFYLTFTLEPALALLSEAGFEVSVTTGVFPKPYQRFVVVSARRQ
ncbi:MAG: class I SAM-dependent methyltransferase [Myxococcales bacterium]|jgi:SAM-dependent methyltransferase